MKGWPSCITKPADRVLKGACAGLDHIRALRIEREQGATVMQQEAVAGYGDTRAEVEEVAVHPGDHVAVLVGGRQHDGIARHLAIAGRSGGRGVVWIELAHSEAA